MRSKILLSKLLDDPSNENLDLFLKAVTEDYIKHLTGRSSVEDILLPILTGKETSEEWIKSDHYFRKWFAKEFLFVWKWDNEGNVYIEDLRWKGVRKSGVPFYDQLPPEARPRDVDDLIPEV